MKTKLKKNTIKGVKAWAVLNKGKLDAHYVHRTKKLAKLNCFDSQIIPVLITPIKKVVKNKVGK